MSHVKEEQEEVENKIPNDENHSLPVTEPVVEIVEKEIYARYGRESTTEGIN